MDLAGAVALVTGGASGLGRATAQTIRDKGAEVVILDLPGAHGEQAAKDLGHGATFIGVDVTSEQQVSKAIELAAGQGPIRLLVNCAGVATPGKVLGRGGVLAQTDFDRVVRINLSGTFNVIRLAAQRMAQTEPVDGERGVIVNTSSVAAFDGQIGQPAYSASKGAVAAMTLPLAREFARHLIRVVSIAPGAFETPMMAGLPPDAQTSLGRQVPHPSRLGRPSEYAALVAHIVDNPMLNGEVIRLDGAIRMQPT
ncbi:3-hydroxyacyl-CoA dehydrogenase [Mycolicibacterium anyangense]|uniref:3-hydroxyacyl-CoA dehydrogenase n=1 Tax=Mycolicibacterium anyangense TaxID=1431246 RepID=A0A6N4W9D6_9MYCO|nr:SDR family NAD(P)-dependent oxidoreductase [Mycolicibacterium anyangense]BBZ78576.1 3-hydroxyacyl-CoA dehydrogenase [Mycolicibacterium anyangense]